MNRLKELRKKAKISQKDFSKEREIPLRTLQSWENGESQIKPEKAQQLAEYFDVSIGYLLGYEDDNSFVSSVVNETKQIDPETSNIQLKSDFKNKIELAKYVINLNEHADRMEEDRQRLIKHCYNFLKGLDFDDVSIVSDLIDRLYFSQYSIEENEKLEKYRDKLSKSFKK